MKVGRKVSEIWRCKQGANTLSSLCAMYPGQMDGKKETNGLLTEI